MIKQTIRVTVDGRSGWIDTGLDIGAGESLRVATTGYIHSSILITGFYAYPEGVYGVNNVQHPADGPQSTLDFTDPQLQIYTILSNALSETTKPFSIIVLVSTAAITQDHVDNGNALQPGRDTTYDDTDIPGGGRVYVAYNYVPGFGGLFGLLNEGAFNVTLDRILETDPSPLPFPWPDHQISPINELPEGLKRMKQSSRHTSTYFWFVQPLNGPAEAWTNWDQDIERPGYEDELGNLTPAMTYLSRGIDLSAFPENVKPSVEMPDAVLIRMDREKMLAGYYDSAYVEVFECDVYGDPDEREVHFVGEFGEADVDNLSVTINLVPLSEKLNRDNGARIQPVCDVGRLPGETWGRGRCRNQVKLDGPDAVAETRGGIVTQVSSLSKFTLSPLLVNGFAAFENTFHGNNGILRFTPTEAGGQNKGVSRDIGTFDPVAGVVILRRAMPFAPQVGDKVEIEPGCSKLREDCIFWNNLKNARFFDKVPTQSDVLRKYTI